MSFTWFHKIRQRRMLKLQLRLVLLEPHKKSFFSKKLLTIPLTQRTVTQKSICNRMLGHSILVWKFLTPRKNKTSLQDKGGFHSHTQKTINRTLSKRLIASCHRLTSDHLSRYQICLLKATKLWLSRNKTLSSQWTRTYWRKALFQSVKSRKKSQWAA